jgi:hypothetical protein
MSRAGKLAGRAFDLDDICSQISEPLAGEWPHGNGRQVDDADP